MLIDSIENHNTQLELIFLKNGKYELNFYNLPREEWREKNRLKISLLKKKKRKPLLEKGLAEMTIEELKTQIIAIYKSSSKDKISSWEIAKILESQGFAVLREEILQIQKEIRKKEKK